MRLHLTLPELEEGSSIQTGPSARMLDLEVLSRNRHPIAIVPIHDHDHRIISAVLFTENAEYHGSVNALKITFKPLRCRAFTLCAAKKDQLMALILQIDDGQYWVDKQGWRQSNLTVDGPGTDPKSVYNSQFLLGDLLAEYPRPRLIDSVIELLHKKYLLCQEEKEGMTAILT